MSLVTSMRGILETQRVAKLRLRALTKAVWAQVHRVDAILLH